MEKRYNLRERKQQKSGKDKEELTETTKLNQNVDEKNGNKKKSSWGSCCIFVLIFAFPLMLLPIVPYLRIDTSIQAHNIKLPPAPKFEGNLKENNLLQNAVYIAKGKLRGPETILFVNDTIYTGLTNGQIVSVDKNGNVKKVVQIGDESEEICNSLEIEQCRSNCGRPLGLRYKSNFIYLVDGYFGVYRVNLQTSAKEVVIAANDKQFDKPLKFIDDLDIDEDNIFFTVSSRKRELHESFELHLEAIPDGRVFQYNEKSKKVTLLMDNLVFPNGIQLTPNKDALIIAEHGMARLIKYYLKGPKQGQHEILANVPGFPDNLRLSDHNTLFVALPVVRSPNPSNPSLLDLWGEYPLIRTIFGSVVDLNKLLYKLPKYGFMVEYDLDGMNVLRSWHDPTGKHVGIVTCVTQHKNKLYLGSFIDEYIAVIDY